MKSKRRNLINIHVLFIIVTMAEIIGTLGLSALLAGLLRYVLNRVVEIPDVLWILIFSVTIGLAASVIVNILLLKPIVRLNKAMRSVAQGDFNVRLATKSAIREVRDLYGSFNLMVEELGNTETLQSDFVSNVSHEFKTPLSAIEGYATLLQSGGDEAQMQQYTEKILLNTGRLSTLVGNILLLSKASNQAIPAPRTTYRLDEQIRQAILLLEPRWTEKNVEFEADLEELTWTGPEGLMQHVWINLISNAIKFGPENGVIRISLKYTDGRFVFTVEDQGEGVPEAEQKHIFNRFYQLDSSHRQEGSGLGLALCKQILTPLNAVITVENLPGTGCRFVVDLPAAA